MVDFAFVHSSFHPGVPGATFTVVGDAIEVYHHHHWANCCPEYSPSIDVTDRRVTITHKRGILL
jgi:hypothetical protein